MQGIMPYSLVSSYDRISLLVESCISFSVWNLGRSTPLSSLSSNLKDVLREQGRLFTLS